MSFIDVVVEARGLGCSKYFEEYARTAAKGGDSGSGRLYIAAKDAALARDLARHASLDLPILASTADAFAAAMEAGWAEAELTAVSRIIERRSRGSENGEGSRGGPFPTPGR